MQTIKPTIYPGHESLRSDSLQEIISTKKRNSTLYALPIFLLILIITISGTCFIDYPDIIQADAILTAVNAPKEIVTHHEGKLIKLFISNESTVSEGQPIAWLESTARHKQVILLSNFINDALQYLSVDKMEKLPGLFNTNLDALGELQISYQQFIGSWQQFNDYLINGYYYKRKKVLIEDLTFLQKMHKNIEQEKDLLQQDIQLTQETFDTDNNLFADKVLSKQDLRDIKSKLVTKKINLPQLEASLLSNENSTINKQKEIAEMEHTISQQKEIFEQSLQTLKSAVDSWMNTYILKAPVNGNAVFITYLQENQYIQSGKTIGYVNPSNSRYFAQVILPQTNFGKLDTGQSVQLRFQSYPYQEFGFVKGRLSYISTVPSDSGFLATIKIPDGLMTNYKKKIQYRNGLTAQALIITNNITLFKRIYQTIIKNAQER